MIFVKETILNQFSIPSYPSITSLEKINMLLSKLCHLLSFQALYLKKIAAAAVAAVAAKQF